MTETTIDVDDRLFFKRSAMVLFALEQSLGSYVRENVSELNDLPKDQIQKFREGPKKVETVDGLIQETYVSEILDLAIAAATMASDLEPLQTLKKLADCLELFDIRNAIAHPNRPFPDCYWYRLTAIANDPAMVILGFNAVKHAFESAIADKITLPPEDWFSISAFTLPNNLPRSLDHEITGLIGRNKEKRELGKTIKNGRYGLIALVGPGGTGKTAIALDLLRDAALDPRTCEWADEIVFVTAKTEQLTKDGPVPIDNPIVSIDEVKAALVRELVANNELEDAETLEQVAEAVGETKVFICLDNLETLLRDHPAPFDEFYEDLPESWRLLVTSRIPVDSARNISIDRMQVDAAGALARKYLQNRGGAPLEPRAFEQLVDKTDRNPLAIRVSVDCLVSGLDVATALSQTRDNILEFSYTNLLKNLPSTANQVLECLFAANRKLTRHEVRSLLDEDIDQVAIGLQSLLRTSLITRHADENIESYGLSSSVRDLLLRHPLDDGTRSGVFRKLAEQHSTIQQVRSDTRKDPLDKAYIAAEVECPDALLHDIFRAFQMIRRREAKAEMADHLERLRSECNTHSEPALYRAMTALLLELNDRDSARQMLELAREREALDSSGRLMLAELYKGERRLEECFDISKPLRSEGWFEPHATDRSNLRRLANVTWLVGIWLEKALEEVPNLQDWNQDPTLRATKGCMYATALRRLLERETDARKVGSYIKEMIFCLDQIIRADGYLGFVVAESVKAINEISGKIRSVNLERDEAQPVIEFADTHLQSLCQVHSNVAASDASIQQFIHAMNTQAQALGLEAIGHCFSGFTDDPVLAEYGYIPVKVYAPAVSPSGSPRNYLFAEDSEGVQYHVSKRVFEEPQRFSELKEGASLLVRPRDDYDEGRAIPVQDAITGE